MALLQDVAVGALMEAPQCPTSVAEFAVLRSTKELCRRAKCWRIDVPWANFYGDDDQRYQDISSHLDDVSTYASIWAGTEGLTYAPTLADIISIARDDGAPIPAKSVAQMNVDHPGWRNDTDTTDPTYWVKEPSTVLLDGENRFRFWPHPTGGSKAKSIPDGATLSTAVTQAANPAITFVTAHEFAVGDIVQYYNFSGVDHSAGATAEALWRSFDHQLTRVTSIVDTDTIEVASPATNAAFFDPPNDWAGISYPGLTPGLCKVEYYIRVAAMPDISIATAIPDNLLQFHEETIVHGALAYILRMPEAPWYNPQMSDYHNSLFERGVVLAKAESEDEHTTGVHRTVKYGGL